MNDSSRYSSRLFWRAIAGGVFGIIICLVALVPLVHYRSLSEIAKLIPARSTVIITVRPSGNPLLPTPISLLPLHTIWHTANEWFGITSYDFYTDVVMHAKQLTIGAWFDNTHTRHAVVVIEFYSSSYAHDFSEKHERVQFISGSTVMITTDDVARDVAAHSAGEPLTASRVPSTYLQNDPVSVMITPSLVLPTTTNEIVRAATSKNWYVTLNTKTVHDGWSVFSALLFQKNTVSNTTVDQLVATTTDPALTFLNVPLDDAVAMAQQEIPELQTAFYFLQNTTSTQAVVANSFITHGAATVMLFTDDAHQSLRDYVVVLPYETTGWSSSSFEQAISSVLAFRNPIVRTHALPDHTSIKEVVADTAAFHWLDGAAVTDNNVTLRYRVVSDAAHGFTFAYATTTSYIMVSNNTHSLARVASAIVQHTGMPSVSCNAYAMTFSDSLPRVVVNPLVVPASWRPYLPDTSVVFEEVSDSFGRGCVFESR